MVTQIWVSGSHLLTNKKMSLLLQRKQLQVFVANDNSSFQVKIRMLENSHPPL